MRNKRCGKVRWIGLLTLLACSTLACGMLPVIESATPSVVPPSTPLPEETRGPTLPPDDELTLVISLDGPVEPPQEIYAITIEMADPEAASCDWMVGDLSGLVAEGRLDRGQSTQVEIDVDWSERPLLSSNRLFYVYGEGDDGSTFAEALVVDFDNPPTTVDPTATLSCGYARFVVTTEELSVEYPESSFSVGIADEGILQCGSLDWWIVEPPAQPDVFSCAPSSGFLEAEQSEEIQCAIAWDSVAPGQARDYFLFLFSTPRVNGSDSVHLVRVRVVKP